MHRSLWFTFILLPIFAYTQESAVELDPVSVTASLQPLPISKTGRNIISVPGNYFDRFPVHSIDELLRYIPGVEVQQRGPAGSQSDIVLRGGTFQQVLVILDGIRLNDPNTGHFNSYIPIAPSEIERVEVLKGASSALYGTEAVGGVIHVISKSFAAKKGIETIRGTASFTAGEYGLLNGSAGAYWQKNNTAVGAGILTNNSDGQQQRGTRGFFHNQTASLSVKQFIGQYWSVSLRSSFDQRRFGAQNFYTSFVSDSAKEKVTTNWNQLSIHYRKGQHMFSVDAAYKSVEDNYRYNPASTPNENKSKLAQLLVTEHFRLHTNTMLSGGVQFQDRRINSNDRGNHSIQQLAGFVILHQQVGDFSFSPSVRVDYSERRGTEVVPQLNLSYRLENIQLRASAGKTIRDADFTERYNNYNKAYVSGGSIGNPNLVAERSFSYEAGLDYFLSQQLRLSLTGFQRRQSELIDWISTPYSEMPRKDNLSPTGTYALARNIADVITGGVEADIQFSQSLGKAQKLVSTLGILWLESKGSNSIPSFYLSSHAQFMTNVLVEYRHSFFALNVAAIYKNRKPQQASAIQAEVKQDLFMMNARASSFLPGGKFTVFIEVDNVFDHPGQDLLGSRLPGRWLMGGINFSFGKTAQKN